MTPAPSLRPVSGSAGEIESLVRRWLGAEAPPPLTVRTSGSSGAPKDVELTSSAVRASARSSLERLGGPGSWVLALPPEYVAGLQVIVRSVLAGASPVPLAEHPDLASATRALPAGRRYLSVVPTQLHRWLLEPAARGALQQYDAVLVGGAAANPALVSAAAEAGVAVVTTYGMSETAGGCVYDGVPLDEVAVALGVDGSIRLSGPVLFSGYAGDPEGTAEVLRDGWLTTADLGTFDLDGRLVVLGRADDVVSSGGVKVPLLAVEARLAQLPGVQQAAVTSLPDEEWGACVVAVVVADGRPPALAALRDHVAEGHPRSWAPRDLVIVDSLPMLESGKVDRRRLRELVEARRG